MNFLIPIKYHKRNYPKDINPIIEEISSHFDISKIEPKQRYSLYTEYSYGKRKLDSSLISEYKNLTNSNHNGVPELWKSNLWAEEFASFIDTLIDKNITPDIIEIHPPFNNYIADIIEFIDIYKSFEDIISSKYPTTKILIENRYGTVYTKGNFLISSNINVLKLSEAIDNKKLKLAITLDVPQLLAYHNYPKLNKEDIGDLLFSLIHCRHNIEGIHLWGKKTIKFRPVAHIGDLNSLFNNDSDKKSSFLKSLFELFNDNKERYFLPEVNSNNSDLESIVNDLRGANFNFMY